MYADIIEMREFYETALGSEVQRLIARRLRTLWPDVQGLDVLGLGFATPFLQTFRSEANAVIALMPALQGAMRWPPEDCCSTALIDPTDLPLLDRSVHRILLVHALECSEQTRPMMREVWRVLTDGGRLIVVVPNRRGLWAHFDHTPFGVGRPYSSTQLTRHLSEWMFSPCQTTSALFLPPVDKRIILSSSRALEEIGQRWFGAFAGVVVFEATKQIYGGKIVFEKETAPVYAPVPSR